MRRKHKDIMKKIMLILTVLVVGILVLSGFGVVAVTNKMATTIDNQPPEKPEIEGPLVVPPGTHEWTFEAIDPDGDNISYEIDWDDGHIEGWLGPFKSGEKITRNHTYPGYRSAIIRARAKDTHGAISDWGYILVEFSKSKQTTNPFILRFLERFIDYFLMLE